VLTDALLRKAIREHQKFAGYKSRRGAKLFREVDQWFSAAELESCFSFINVCRILNLHTHRAEDVARAHLSNVNQ